MEGEGAGGRSGARAARAGEALRRQLRLWHGDREPGQAQAARRSAAQVLLVRRPPVTGALACVVDRGVSRAGARWLRSVSGREFAATAQA
eukprot:2806385-Pyramimonas_sp.AAC.1